MGRLNPVRSGTLLPVALVAFCTLWRLPGLSDPPLLNDEGVYATVGRAITQGEALYRQVWENKPPAIYLLYGAVHRVAGPSHILAGVRCLALLAALVAQFTLFRLVTIANGDRTVALLATLIAGLGFDLPLLDGTSANAEIFLAACTTAGMALLWLGIVRHMRYFFVAGIAFGLATLFKLVAGADLLAAIAMLASWRGERRDALGILLLGVALPLSAVVVWLGAQGLIGDALYAAVGYNRGYVTTGQGMHTPSLTALSLLGPIVLIATGVWLVRRTRESAIPSFSACACWWLALALIGALASGRSYTHYYLQAVGPAAVCAALLVATLLDRVFGSQPAQVVAKRTTLLVLMALWTLGVPLGSWLALEHAGAHAAAGSDQAAYYAYFWQYHTGALDATAYGNRIDPRVERNIAVARYLAAHPMTPRRLYVWGNAPWIYYLSGYEHAARFLSAYYRPAIPGGEAQVLAALIAQPPPYVVLIEPPLPASRALSTLLRTRYTIIHRVGNAVIYLRRSTGG